MSKFQKLITNLMNLPAFDDIMKNHRLGFFELFNKVLKPWACQNKFYLDRILDNRPLIIKDEMKQTFEHNFESFIVDYNGWSSKESKRVSVNIFIELSRSNFLLNYNEIIAESDEIKKLEGLPTKDYNVLWSMSKSKHFPDASNLAIMMYKQTDVINLLLLLTEKLDQLTFDSISELERILKLLWTRNAVFVCQVVENDSGMTLIEYMTFCTIYFHAIFRRMFYYKLIPKGPNIDLPFDNCKKWIRTEVCEGLGSEGFEDCYAKACEECYHFPGDLEWFKFRYPEMQAQTGPILDCFRKEMAKKYFTDYRSSMDSVLAVYNQPSHSGQCSRTFIINAIDQYMRMHFNIPWKDGVVIKNDGIEGSKHKLFRKSAPFIVQVYSRYSVYEDSKIYSSDDIYQTFTFWCLLLYRNYKSQLFGTDLGRLVKKILL